MKRFNGGTQVQGGYYFNLASWEINTVVADKSILPGEASEQFYKVPVPVLFVLAPVMGAAFAVALPFLGFAMPVYALVKKLGNASAKAAQAAQAAATATPAWTPADARLVKPGADAAAAVHPKV